MLRRFVRRRKAWRGLRRRRLMVVLQTLTEGFDALGRVAHDSRDLPPAAEHQKQDDGEDKKVPGTQTEHVPTPLARQPSQRPRCCGSYKPSAAQAPISAPRPNDVRRHLPIPSGEAAGMNHEGYEGH